VPGIEASSFELTKLQFTDRSHDRHRYQSIMPCKIYVRSISQIFFFYYRIPVANIENDNKSVLAKISN
jgi:hypothetical protein